MDLQQIKQLQEIGRTLQKARQDQDVLLEEVYARTFIQVRLLKALEVGDVKVLPEPIFVQGFIKRYANLLGLDGASMAEAFMKGSPVAEPQAQTAIEQQTATPVAPVQKPLVAEVPQKLPTVSGRENHQGTIAETSSAKVSESLPPLKPLTLEDTSRHHAPWFKPPGWVYVVIGAFVLSAGLANLINSSKPRQQMTKPPSSPVTSPQPEKLDSSQAIASEKPSPQSGSPIQLEVELTSESWVQVKIDGKTEFEGTLGKGEKRNWQAKDTLYLQAGNAGAVLASLNGKEAKPLGDPGAVMEVTYTPKSAN